MQHLLGVDDKRLLQQVSDGLGGLCAHFEPLLDGGRVQVGLLAQRVIPSQPLQFTQLHRSSVHYLITNANAPSPPQQQRLQHLLVAPGGHQWGKEAHFIFLNLSRVYSWVSMREAQWSCRLVGQQVPRCNFLCKAVENDGKAHHRSISRNHSCS